MSQSAEEAKAAMAELFGLFSQLKTTLSSSDEENPILSSPEEWSAQLLRIREVSRIFLQILADPTLTPDQFFAKMSEAYNAAQKEFETDCGFWQRHVSCWDFNPKQLQQIQEEMRKLPPGTPILSPLCGRGFLEACLQKLGLFVICNDIQIESDGLTFVDASQISHSDGLVFLKSYHAGHPETQFAELVSWAPQEGHPGFEISKKIFKFASECPTSVGVFHVSEGNQDDGNYGCTDTEEAFEVIEAKFNRPWKIARQKPIWKKTNPSHADIADYLSWRVPRRGSKK